MSWNEALVSREDGELWLRVRALPGAKRDRILGLHGEALRVAVAAPPERGKANRALIDTLARELELPRSAVVVAKGAGSRDKLIEIRGAPREEVLRRLSKLTGSGAP